MKAMFIKALESCSDPTDASVGIYDEFAEISTSGNGRTRRDDARYPIWLMIEQMGYSKRNVRPG